MPRLRYSILASPLLLLSSTDYPLRNLLDCIRASELGGHLIGFCSATQLAQDCSVVADGFWSLAAVIKAQLLLDTKRVAIWLHSLFWLVHHQIAFA